MDTASLLDGEYRSSNDNLETFSLIWLDSTVDDAVNQNAQRKLRTIINYLKKFQNVNECQQYIEQRSKDDRLVIIVSGRFGREVVPNIHQLRQISSIYVFCMDKKANEKWANNFSKIKAVIIDANELVSTIEIDQNIRMKIEEPLSFHSFNKNADGDLIKTKTNNQFIYFQLLINSLLGMKCNENDKNKLIPLLRKEYKDNDDQLHIIDEFQKEYSSEKVFGWYTRHSFFNKILRKALYMQNIPIMFLFHSFISDLYHQLKQHQSKDQLRVFHCQLLSNAELDVLKESLGQLISIDSFWSASIDRLKALADLNNFKVSTDLQRVLFEIDVDPTLAKTKPFALINSQDDSVDPSEVLFMTASIFSLTEIICSDDQLWIVKMTLCSDEEYPSIFNSIQINEQNENEQSNLRTFAKILWKMGKLDLADHYYNCLIDELPPNDPLLMIVYDDLGTMALEKENYEISVQWYRKSIAIKTQNSYTKTDGSLDSFPGNECVTHRPLCEKHDSCDQLNDEAHRRVFRHRLSCKFGGQCRHIDNEGHSKTYKHPDFCVEKGFCGDMTESHLIKYCHVPLCKNGLSCSLLIKYDTYHCTTYRHCKTNCPLSLYCSNFHNNEHIEGENHPFKPPCPYTPYMCHFYDKLSANVDQTDLSGCDIHCFKYSHVCPRGRQCTDLSNKEHIQSHIHLIRMECPDKDTCQLMNDENHLNSYSHPTINDIRSLCDHARSDCPNRFNSEHIKQFRHTGHFDYIGVSRYLALNKNINFLQNQNDMIENIQKYIQSSNWNPLTITISDELKHWIGALQPIHRCNKLIFESILVHGHVMSRDHMNSLRESSSVAKAIKQHTKVKRIFEGIKNPRFQQTCEAYIQLLVEIQFNKANTTTTDAMKLKDQSLQLQLQPIELILKDYVKNEDIETVRKWTNEISEASLQLHSNPTGIGFTPDQNFGTNKHVFGILGPHTGYYYGDIIIIFRRELMYHPDSNFSIQAATTFGQSMNAYKWRPWLTDPGSPQARIEHFHRNKLHCSIQGYENAAAYELIALTGLKNKSTIDVDLNLIKQRWLTIDSHCVFEAHLPQLIPLDYIERVYIAQTTFDSLSNFAQQSAKTIFGDAICITPHQIDVNIKPAGLHKPLDPTRIPYQSFVVNDMCQRIEKQSNDLPLIQGTFIVTLPSSHFKDYIIIPMTISQSYNQYKSTQTSSTDLSNSIYIYWEAFNGDMMLTLTNQIIDTNSFEQNNHLQCLTCYIAKWPLNNTIKTTISITPDYREGYSYIGNHHPIKHYFIIDDLKFKSSSNTFHRGCNVDDYMMYNLIIDRNTNQVTLSIVGSNSIYNHQNITYTFNQTELDLNNLEFIQLSAGLQTVPIRNLVIKHQPIQRFHPLIDTDFIETKIASYTTEKPIVKQYQEELSSTPPCLDSIHCLLQYVETKEGKEHIEQYSHPCRFSELCHRKSVEPHLVHIPHLVPMCQNDDKCSQLGEALHRAQFRHSKLPDYLIPCKYQQQCKTKTIEHRKKYSHGETIPLPSLKESTKENQL